MSGDGVYRFLLRMPQELRDRLTSSASESGRSLNREIVERLQESLEAPEPQIVIRGNPGEVLRMRSVGRKRVALVLATTIAALIAVAAGLVASGRVHSASSVGAKLASKEIERGSQGTANGGQGGESSELMAAMQQFDNARSAPSENGAAPGAYSAAYGNLQLLPVSGGGWDELTRRPYDADDPDYRDYYSNSSGGSGLVTGRITGLAADGDGYVYAAAADGGVWRSSTGGGNWTPISDALPSLSSGDLKLAADGSLWYATGEANTGGTSYAGTGVYRLANPRTGTFNPLTDRVGQSELESTTINSIRFTKDTVWVATLRGIFSHPLGSYSSPWSARFQPNPSYLPGGANAGVQKSGYMNIVNDLVIDPANDKHLVAAVGWRSGAAYNGFYESTDGGTTWNRVNPAGGLDATDIGNASFAYSADGKKLYVINQAPSKITKGGMQNTYLDGIYESDKGLLGPWNRIATSDKLGARSTGSALNSNFGQGYSPGIQSWYNQFITVDPANANHVIVGLEEVYETNDGGANWHTIGPYWNFYFKCWAPDSLYPPDGTVNRCPQSTHPDQHSVAIGKVNGVDTLFVGNDGGVFSRALNGPLNANNNATDWKSLNDGTIDALQYYYVGVGKLQPDDSQRPDLTIGDNVLVSGGLQDNGGSLLRPGAPKMVSNFGGDGGDVLVDPNDGCNIVQEYVYLTMEVTKTCANPGPDHPNAFLDLSQSTTHDISPPDINAQFIAPFTANDKNINQWVAAGNSLWYQDKGFDISSGSQWQKIYTLPTPNKTFTAVSFSGNTLLATWCGPCSASGSALFQRGAVVGTFAGGTWTVTPVSFAPDFPNRYLQGAAINPNDSSDLFLGVNGFSRRFTDGPGAGLGHVFESKAGGPWVDITTNMPDIPVNDIVVLPSGGLAVATDLGVVYRAPNQTAWTRLGAGLPTTTVMDLSLGPDGKLYVATHGRGLWRISTAGL
ncbi:MAG TPA: Arc family DNA-binding protein [Gaiellaceae bacterium]|nr:Arc family DNA-binding protein [Gaiellaceae bacterium]